MKYSLSLLLVFTVLLSAQPRQVSAQDQGKMYFDESWSQVKFRDEASYVRRWKKLGDQKYLINDHYITGELQMKVVSKTIDDLVKMGTCTWYSKSGEVTSKSKYKDGELHGDRTVYYKGGDIKTIIPFDEGDRHGIYQEFYQDSILKAKGEYLADDREGEWRWYYVNGQLAESTRYEEDKIQGVRKGFYPDGSEYFQIEFNKEGKRNGNFVTKYTNGKTKIQGAYRNGKESGSWKSYSEDATILLEGQFGQGSGMKQGQWTHFYENGNVRATISYENDLLEGSSEWFYPNGQLAVKESYKEGLLSKRKGYSEDGSKLNPEEVYNDPSLSQNKVEALFLKYTKSFEQNKVEDLGVKFQLGFQ